MEVDGTMVAVVALGVMVLVTAVQLGRRFGAVEQGVTETKTAITEIKTAITEIKTAITATDATIAKTRSEFSAEFVQFRKDIREARKRPTAPAGAMETPGLTILGATLTPKISNGSPPTPLI